MRQRTKVFLLWPLVFELCSCKVLRMMTGSGVDLPCFAPQTEFTEGSISWTFNGKKIEPETHSSSSTKMIKNGWYLNIFPVTFTSQGEYTCTAKLGHFEVTKTYNITVDESFSYTFTVAEGSDVDLPCLFPSSGKDTNALWFKESSGGQKEQVELGNDKKLDLLNPMERDQTAILRNAVMEDAGVYHCESPGGQTLSIIHLTITALPTVPPFSCGATNPMWELCQDENSRSSEAVLRESLTEFSMKLFSHLRGNDPAANLLFSPISISGLLSHLLLGARDSTRQAFERAVCIPHDYHCVHVQMKQLRETLAQSLQIASKIYYNPEMDLTQSFLNQSIQYYNAEPAKLLESSEENIQMINNWVAEKTENKITHLVDSVSPNTQLILLNAVSFSGEWKVKFNQKPKTEYFTKLDGDMVQVPVLYHSKYMMALRDSSELKARVARFSLSGENSLYILLPLKNKPMGLQQMEESLTVDSVSQMVQQMKAASSQATEVTLPKIKLTDEPNMNLLLKKLGLSSLFEGASLCGLYQQQEITLDEARHKAFLRLTEEGVEAAAATSLSFSRSFPSFSAMRPFVLLLWSDRANVPLFVGRVTDP